MSKSTHKPYQRTRAGCLPCRRRRKKCDQSTPLCLGCRRNHLICTWPSVGPKLANSLGHSAVAAQVGSTQDGSPSLAHFRDGGDNVQRSIHFKRLLRQPSSLPPLFQLQPAGGLLEYFKLMTAPRMVCRSNIENPFITYNLRLATVNTSLQHAILAIGACHRAYTSPDFSSLAYGHYAVAVRSLKFGITGWHACSAANRAALVASCLALCWYEIIHANIRGALYHHLRASGYMIRDLQDDSKFHQDELLGFFIEQYSYLAILANIDPSGHLKSQLLDPHTLTESLTHLHPRSPIYGFLFGVSHDLFALILRTTSVATQQGKLGPIHANHYDFILEIVSRWATTTNVSHDLTNQHSGRMYQAASLIYLHVSKHGLQEVTENLEETINPCINLFLQSFQQLPFDSPQWTTFMWPSLVAGSCMRDPSHRQALSKLFHESNLQMEAVDSTARWLSRHWANMDRDPAVYGIRGLCGTLSLEDVLLCVG